MAQTSVCDATFAILKLMTLRGGDVADPDLCHGRAELGRTGQPFWQDESFDHWSRDRAEFARIVAHIENNPVKAGLVKRPEEWIWSSAAERKRRGWDDFRALT